MSMWPTIAEHISAATGTPFSVSAEHHVGGGCISSAFRIDGNGQRYFVKVNSADQLDMFAAEAEGLSELANAHAVRVPASVCWGVAEHQAFLVLENLDLGGGNGKSAEQLGRSLAALHRYTRPQFGWHRDNTIGSTPQINTASADWLSFWRQHRLGFQLELAAHRGYGGSLQRKGEALLEVLAALFDDYHPVASCLHGDLWSGNFAVTRAGEPVIFDPAVYFGDREADLAMTELFGGFPARFYDAYNEVWPVDSGYAVRKTFYNLYHILNHLNLFGGGYGGQAERMMDQLLSELR